MEDLTDIFILMLLVLTKCGHWRKEWKKHQVFLPENCIEQCERQRTLKIDLSSSVVALYAAGKGGKCTESMKRAKPRNNIQLWMCLVMEVKSDVVKNNIA